MSQSRFRPNTGFINPHSLPTNTDGFRMCRYCDKSIIPPRRTFCSAECVHQYRLRTSTSYLRQCVWERDVGICGICGIDTKQIAEQILSAQPEDKQQLLTTYNIHNKRKICIYSLWDADHILPVMYGGGECDISNIRTLCLSCHKIVTKSLLQNKKKI